MRLALALVLALVGCGRCDDATCLAEKAVADWPADPAAVSRRVAALPDEVTRTVVVGALCDAYPGQTRSLCASLPEGLSRERCNRLNGRPHLSFNAAAQATVTPRGSGDVPPDVAVPVGEAPGERSEEAPRVKSFPEVYLPVPAVELEPDLCFTEPDRAACRDATARDAALDGEAGRAEAVCALHTTTKWADECRFNAAEQATRKGRKRAYATAAALCGRSSGFSQECWAHVLTWLPRRIPSPDAGKAEATAAAGRAHEIATAWEDVDAAAGARHVDRYWALYFANVYRQSPAPDGTPLSFYPEEAWPHIRASVAMRLREIGRLTGPLAAQVAELERVLATRTAGRPDRGRPPDLVFVQDMGELPTEVPSVFFLGAARRPVSADAAVDTVLCVLESAAHAAEPDRAVLEEGTHHPDAMVAAEATRLLGRIGG